MRLSDEKARRLSALVWRERLRRWLPVAAGLVFMAAVFGFVLARQIGRADRTVDVRQHDGTITGHKSLTSARGASILYVRLDDGRNVDAFSTLRVAPPNGSHVVIAEARHASGRLTYDIVRLLDQ
jgi:hypothetical protein